MNDTPAPRRAVLYGRVSKLTAADRTRARRTGHDEGKSVDDQLDELRVMAGRDSVQVLAEFRDDGKSASRHARTGVVREGWLHTMDMIESGRVTELWTWEISRATRDRPVWAALLAACQAQRVLIVICGRVHDPNDADDAFLLDLFAALAVRETDVARKRILRATSARAAAGQPHGRIPYGYRRIYDEFTGALLRQEPCPETKPLVQELVRRVLKGEALYKLAVELNQRGVPSPEAIRKRRNGDTEAWFSWRPDQVRDVVASPAAAGLRVHQGKVLDGVTAAWEPIVKRRDHDLIVAKFADPTRRTWVDASAKHLLTGLARCGECGGEIRRIKNRGTPSYACMGKRHGHDGARRFCVARKIDWVDTYVSDVIVERLSRPDLFDLFVVDDTGDVQAAQQELAVLRAEHSQMIGMAERREISLVAFARMEPVLMADIAAAERRATPASVPRVIADVAGEQAAQRWEALELEQRRAVVRYLATVRIYKRGHGLRGAKVFDESSVVVDWHHKAISDAGHSTDSADADATGAVA